MSALISSKGSVRRDLEEARLSHRGAAEGAALVSEELRLHHVLGERRTIEIDERPDASRQAMYGAGDELFPRAGLADDEHRRVAHRCALDDRQDRTHWRVLRDDLGSAVHPRQPRVQVLILLGELALLPGPPNEYVDLGHPVRLRHVVVGAELHRRDGGLDGPVAGNDDDLGGVGLLAHLTQNLEAVHLRHHDVEEGDVEALGTECLERGATVRDRGDLMSSAREEAREDLTEVLFILGDEDANATLFRHRRLGGYRRGDRARVRRSGDGHTATCSGWLVAAGSTIRKTLPLPTTLSTSMRPEFSATSE